MKVKQVVQLIMGGLLLLGGLQMSSNVHAAADQENESYYQALDLYHQKQWNEARTAFEQFSQNYPKSKWQASVQLRLADMADSSDQAISGYEQVLKNYAATEWSQDARWGLAGTYFTLGQYSKVITLLESVKKTESSRYLQAIQLIGMAHLALKDYPAAKSKFELLATQAGLDSYKQEGLVGLGDSYLGMKNYEQALIAYDRYLNAFPNGKHTNHILNQKVQMFSAQGSKEAALQAMHQLATRFPDSFEAETIKEQLSSDHASDKYTIQVGSFSEKRYALKLEKRLRKKGYNAYHLTTRRQNDLFTQVRVGHYTTRSFAQSIAEKLKMNENLPFVIVPYIKPDNTNQAE